MLSDKYKKITQSLNYLASKQTNKEIDNLKAIKLVWLADRYHLRRFGRPVTWDTYEAMQKGPVGSTTKDIAEQTSYLEEKEKDYSKEYIKPAGDKNFRSSKNPDLEVFSESDVEALDFAIVNFGHFSGEELTEFSHNYPEWKRHEKVLTNTDIRRASMAYEDFFEDPSNLDNDTFLQNKETLALTKEILLENKSILEMQRVISTT